MPNNNSKMSLVEATRLALLGKLTENKKVEESVNVSIQDDGSTVVDTAEATVIVQDKEPEVEEVIEVPVESTETVMPEEVVTPEDFEEEIIPDEVLEEPAELVDEEPEKIEESTETNDKPTEDWSDEEIINYIIDNYQTITGIEMQTIFNPESEEDKGIFNQEVIDQTSDSILALLDTANIVGKRHEDLLYKLDDKLVSLRESKEVITETKPLREDSYEEDLYNEIEAALVDAGLEVSRYSDEGVLTKNIGWIVKNSDGDKANVTCDGTYLEESKKKVEESSPRSNEERILEAIDNGVLSYQTVCEALLTAMSNDDLEDIINEYDWNLLMENKCCEVDKESFTNKIMEVFNKEDKKVESFKINKITSNNKSIKIEGKVTYVEGKKEFTTITFNKIQEGTKFTRYVSCNKLQEGKTYISTFKENNKINCCK